MTKYASWVVCPIGFRHGCLAALTGSGRGVQAFCLLENRQVAVRNAGDCVVPQGKLARTRSQLSAATGETEQHLQCLAQAFLLAFLKDQPAGPDHLWDGPARGDRSEERRVGKECR